MAHLWFIQNEVARRWSHELDNPCHLSATPNHSLLHILKASGKIATALNDAEHEQRKLAPEEVAKYLADLVICASRFAALTGVNLDAATEARIAEKFPTS